MTESVQARYKKLNEALARAVPELRPRYEEETAAWGEEMGPHVIYADVLNPYLTYLLHADEDRKEDEALRRVFGFLESLLADSDPDASNVAAITVAEHLESDPDGLERARRFMGPLMAEATRARLRSS